MEQPSFKLCLKDPSYDRGCWQEKTRCLKGAHCDEKEVEAGVPTQHQPPVLMSGQMVGELCRSPPHLALRNLRVVERRGCHVWSLLPP